MYLNSSAPIPTMQRAADCKAQASNRRLAATQCRVNKGRFQLFNTTPSIASLAEVSPELAVSGAKILQQSQAGRASVLGAGTPAGPIQQPDVRPPIVEPLNTRTAMDLAACGTKTTALSRRPVAEVMTPTMPKAGPMLVQGKIRDVVPRRGGLSGIAPPWGDAIVTQQSSPISGFFDWIKQHPFLSLAVAGGVVYIATDERRRGRRGY
jgi:hypothetical protein